MNLCQTLLCEKDKIDVEHGQDHIDYKGMTYFEIEETFKQLKKVDDRYDLPDPILNKWEMHDVIEYKIKYDFFKDRSNKSMFDICDNFKMLFSFEGLI